MTDTFFDFSLILLASEGSEYFMDAILNCNIWVYISSVVIIISYIFGLKQFKERKKKRVDSPKETDLYDITLDGKSIANDYNAKDIIGFQLQENRVVFKKLIECRKMIYRTGAEL